MANNAFADSVTFKGSSFTGNGLAYTMTGSTGADKLYDLGGGDYPLDALGNDAFVFDKRRANGDIISDFVGNGSAAGDTISLVGWAAGSTLTQVSGTLWAIADGFDLSVANISITGAVHASDILFG